MAGRVYTSVIYAIVRLSIWVALLAAAAFDGIRHRQVRSKGWQLFTLLVASTALFVVKNIAFLAICIQGQKYDGWATASAYISYIFFGDIADSFWIFLLLAISAGFCITRAGFGPHKTVVIVIPTIFLITSFVVDYVLFATSGLQAFDYKTAYASSVPPDEYDPGEYDPTSDPLANTSPTTTFVFLFCTLANFMSFFMAWFYMYDTARSEWQALQNAGADAMAGMSAGVAPHHGDMGSGDVGHTALPTNAALLEEGQNASHLYGDIVAEDLDAPKSVMERIADRDKARLMKHFFFAVSFYLCLAMFIFFVPLFVPMIVDAALLIAYDSLLWIFMAGLLIVFRMRQSNQFLLLTDSGLGGGETTTELGVMYHDDEPETSTSLATKERKQQRKGGGKGGVVPRFTLGDEEEEEAPAFAARRMTTSSNGGVNADAAAHGVVVRPLPSPHS